MKIIIFLLVSSIFAQTSEKGFGYAQWRECQEEIYRRPNIFSVTGFAIYSAKPSIGVLQFGVDKLNMNAAIALQECMKATQKAILEIQTISKDNSLTTLTTSQLSIQQSYDYKYNDQTGENKQIFKGYQVKNTLTVRTKEVDKIGSFIDEGIKAGMNRVDSITFDLDPEDRKKQEDELMVLALRNAKERALKTLDPLGMKIIGIKGISLQSYSPPIHQQEFAKASFSMANDAAPPTQVFAGQQNVDFQVTVNYIIEPITQDK